jgi:hypothetical protein
MPATAAETTAGLRRRGPAGRLGPAFTVGASADGPFGHGEPAGDVHERRSAGAQAAGLGPLVGGELGRHRNGGPVGRAGAAGREGVARNCCDDSRMIANQRRGVNLYSCASQLCLIIFEITEYILQIYFANFNSSTAREHGDKGPQSKGLGACSQPRGPACNLLFSFAAGYWERPRSSGQICCTKDRLGYLGAISRVAKQGATT